MSQIRVFKATRRNLPHWQSPGAVYFLTWCTACGKTLTPEDRSLVIDAIRFWDGTRWAVVAAVVLPDHAHALVRPLPLDPSRLVEGTTHDLGEILGSVKKFSALRINLRHGRTGRLWQDEWYDRIVRDGREFWETWEYIRNNPIAAGLIDRPEEYAWLYEAKTAD